ncbi:MAG: redoxin domain-containing protein [Gemmatimonadetes bacterium]|nr:redoxin domain-containing protein [Gemmatimonadota bacterium]
MSAKRQWAIVGGIVLALGALLVTATLTSSGVKIIGPGAPAPDFSALAVPDSGEPTVAISIAAYKGKPILLNIWATWCAPCREEMPRIERLHRELGPEGLAVVAISINNPGMTNAIREFRTEMGLSFEILYDVSGRIRDSYQTSGVPETFLIDRQGVVRRRLIGSSWTVDNQRALLRELIAESPE